MTAVSRRAVLVGGALGLGAALSVAACGGAQLEVRSGSLRSRHWPGREVDWRITEQQHGDADLRPVVVVLHGRGGRASSAFDDLHLDQHALDTRLTIASVDGGNFYWHARRQGVDSGAMVVDDFLPLVRERTRYDGPIGLLGWSMGGYGALLLASELGPQRIGAVVAESAALWTDAGASAAGAFDDREDFEAHDVFDPARLRTLATIPVRLDCGRSDPFVTGNRAFAKALPSAQLTVDEGGHTSGYWRDHAAAQLRWVARHLRGQ